MENEMKQNEERINEINWKDFEEDSKYISIGPEEQKVVLLANARQDTKEFNGEQKPAITFDVFHCDGTDYKPDEKILSTSSRPLIKKLRPFVEKYGTRSFKVSITRVGEGFDTQYHVKEV